MNAWSVLLGAIVTGVLSYYYVPWLINRTEDRVRDHLHGRRRRVEPRLPGGDALGHVECAIFFLSFLLLQSALLATAWLAFKTAAKWHTWESVKSVSYAEMRVRYRTTVIGTAANIVAALIGATLAHLP